MAKFQVSENAKRKFYIDQLLEKGWTHTKDGVPVHDLPYEELRAEAVLMSFREIDTECEANQFF
ncbi:MAG TPA: hypothetical protein DEO65_04560 [Bacillus bacterium]|uniref:hypothetical protein n=1 Tax=Siminovitchia fordii TaxID=254759 RepID=UPI000375498C|nr:hypothetical protein [Siminovitchia fordii]HBZ09148.1 hypothetical protein [Bacillus sp. (in: firmicutes)]